MRKILDTTDFQHRPSGGPHDLSGDIQTPAAKCRGVAGDRNDRAVHIPFERLKEKEGDHHQIVVGGVGSKALER